MEHLLYIYLQEGKIVRMVHVNYNTHDATQSAGSTMERLASSPL